MNFVPQWRLAPEDWRRLQSEAPQVARLLQHDRRVVYQAPASASDYAAFLVEKNGDDVLADVRKLSRTAAATLDAGFYDAHAMMAAVLDRMYAQKQLGYGRVGNIDALIRTDGACKFCVNDKWSFPLGCPYGKPEEPSPPPGWLEKSRRRDGRRGTASRDSTETESICVA